MNAKIFRILYCSRNNLRGTAEQVDSEVAQILEASRRNNAEVGVTGALFYNSVFFAQVLEGSFREVQTVFERLQLDHRHSDLVVLQSGYVADRDFGEWSMAYADGAAALHSGAPSDAASASGLLASLAGNKLLTFLRDVVANQQGWALPERHTAVRPLKEMTPSAV